MYLLVTLQPSRECPRTMTYRSLGSLMGKHFVENESSKSSSRPSSPLQEQRWKHCNSFLVHLLTKYAKLSTSSRRWHSRIAIVYLVTSPVAVPFFYRKLHEFYLCRQVVLTLIRRPNRCTDAMLTSNIVDCHFGTSIITETCYANACMIQSSS